MTHPIATLRPAAPADAAGIVAIEQLSFVHAGERFEARRIANLLRNPRLHVFVSDDSQRVTGWAAGFTWLRGRIPWGRVYAIAVHPHARGQRLGPRLLEHLMTTLRHDGAQRIYLEVSADNPAAVALYLKAGFTACQTLPDYYGPGRPASRMEWRVPSAHPPSIAPSPAASP